MSLFCFNTLSLGEIGEELRRFSSNLLAYVVEFDFLETM